MNCGIALNIVVLHKLKLNKQLPYICILFVSRLYLNKLLKSISKILI